MERETSARFSFLLGLPAVILAGAVELHTLFMDADVIVAVT
ncbi:MAG: hypothetical protein V7K18_15410 [Nostoc sp.]